MFRAFLRPFLRAPRLAIFTAGVLLSIFAWIITNASLARRIEQDQAMIRKMGFPTEVNELNCPMLPDESNPAVAIMNAASKVNVYSNKNELASDIYYPYPQKTPIYPFNEKWMKAAIAAETALGADLDSIHQVAALPPGRMNIKYSTPLINVMLRNLNQSKQAANAVRDSAYLHNIQNDPAKALDRVLDLHAIVSNTLEDWFLVSHLVRVGEWSMMAEASMTIGATLKAQDLPQTREKILKLITVLLDEKSRQEGIHNAFAGERLNIVDATRYVYQDVGFIKLPSQGNELFASRYFISLEQIINSPDWNTRRTKTIEFPEANDPRALSRIFAVSYSSAIERHFRSIAETRAAALALAAHLYRMEHNGAWPASSRELVPQYLPAIPMDPYCATPTPIEIQIVKGARPDGADRPVIVFSPREEDEKDLGPNPKEPVFSWERRNFREYNRQFRDLTLFERVISPDEESLITEPQETDEAGDEEQKEESPPEINPDQL